MPKNCKMKRIHLERADEQVQEFIRSLPIGKEGCIILVGGKPLLKVLPITELSVDEAKLKAAILNRREESRKLHEEWEAVDRETWHKLPESEG